MSAERHERSPSFRTRNKTAKVNHNSKLLPNDFFPKTPSQSPKKRPEFPSSAEVLDWYQRDESKEKVAERREGPAPQFLRLSRPSMGRISFCPTQQPSTIEKQRYVIDYYQQVKEKLGGRVKELQKTQVIQAEVRAKRQKGILIRPLQALSKDKKQKLIRVIRSQSKPKQRRDTSESSTKPKRQEPSPSRRSLRELPRRDQAQVVVGFDGMVTFSRFK